MSYSDFIFVNCDEGQFIYDLPARLGKCIKSEAYADAVRFYTGAMPIFKVIFSSPGCFDFWTNLSTNSFTFYSIEISTPLVKCSFFFSFFSLPGIWRFIIPGL